MELQELLLLVPVEEVQRILTFVSACDRGALAATSRFWHAQVVTRRASRAAATAGAALQCAGPLPASALAASSADVAAASAAARVAARLEAVSRDWLEWCGADCRFPPPLAVAEPVAAASRTAISVQDALGCSWQDALATQTVDARAYRWVAPELFPGPKQTMWRF